MPHFRAARPLPRRRILCVAVLLAAAAACDRDGADDPLPEPEPPVTERPNVDERLLPFFDRYEAEAARRGIAVDLSAIQLTAEIAEIDEGGVAGSCTFNPRAPNRLVVDEGLWDGSADNDLFREYVVFHELGHCERLRDHREARDPDDRCVSVMASGTGGCRAVYTPSNRGVLLDELFDEAFYNDRGE